MAGQWELESEEAVVRGVASMANCIRAVEKYTHISFVCPVNKVFLDHRFWR
jgi:hypothetical protein